MSIIAAIGTAVPRFCVDQNSVREFSRGLFAETFPEIDRLVTIFPNSHIDQRFLSASPEWFQTDHTFAEKNQLYIDSALEVGKAAIEECLESGGFEPRDIDHIYFVSTTGVATPSIDARLINIMRMRGDIKRTPIWGLGCAGGAAGLARAYEYTRAFPSEKALVLALELCGLTFQRNDCSKSNLVATSLFADGAAAVLVAGGAIGAKGPRILGSQSTLWYDSLDVMGWDINENGLKVLFSRDIPEIVRTWVLPNLTEFLGKHDLDLSKVRHLVAHPGGAKVLEAYADTFGLHNGQLDHARKVLRTYGNMSSPTVLFVLKEFLREGTIRPSEFGLVTALGPGFSSEMVLIQG